MTTPYPINARSNDFNLVAQDLDTSLNARSIDFYLIPDVLLSEDISTVVLGGEPILDRASNHITDRSGNNILSRYNWSGNPFDINISRMDYYLNLENQDG